MPKSQRVYLKDYARPEFTITHVNLDLDIQDDKISVHSECVMHTNILGTKKPIVLNKSHFNVNQIKINGRALVRGTDFLETEDSITIEASAIEGLGETFVIECENDIDPYHNDDATGIYHSGNASVTGDGEEVSLPYLSSHCEAEGFRRITPFIDRPDNIATYKVTLTADKDKFPVLEANGDLIYQETLSGNRHRVTYNDPHPKPSYLFAMIAGPYAKLTDTYYIRGDKTRPVQLEIIFPKGKSAAEYRFSMDMMKKVLRWGEEVFDMEFDCSVYRMVGVEWFNMGAMENKGLVIFNNAYLSAQPRTTDDMTFLFNLIVVCHEYNHNWAGDRVTVRDWAQLSLKEGLATIMEKMFACYIMGSVVPRLNGIRTIKTRQFAEDGGPLAHAVRPQSYESIDNFYTTTIYDKGAAILNMLRVLLGDATFIEGVKYYFKHHDLERVRAIEDTKVGATVEDFVAAMEAVSGKDLTQFKCWYDQAGTPEVTAVSKYDADKKRFELVLTQMTKATPGQPYKVPLHIPIQIGLIGSDGHDITFTHDGKEKQTHTLELREAEERFVFDNITQPPVLSFLRDFSAPVRVHHKESREALLFKMKHDSDVYCRLEATHQLLGQEILRLMQARTRKQHQLNPELLAAYIDVLKDPRIDDLVRARLCQIPSLTELDLPKPHDHQAISKARDELQSLIAKAIPELLAKTVERCHESNDDSFSTAQMGYRALKNLCLSILVHGETEAAFMGCMLQFTHAKNLTDKSGALSALLQLKSEAYRETQDELLEDFYQDSDGNEQLLEEWLVLHSSRDYEGALDDLQKLIDSNRFDWTNPNQVHGIFRTLTTTNLAQFHHPSGRGYTFLADALIKLGPINAQKAAGIARSFNSWHDLDEVRAQKMKAEIERVLATPKLAKEVREVLETCLDKPHEEKAAKVATEAPPVLTSSTHRYRTRYQDKLAEVHDIRVDSEKRPRATVG